MKKSDSIRERIISTEEIKKEVIRMRLKSKTIAFTYGVFDRLDEGNIALLSGAAAFADILIVGVQSDASLQRVRGKEHAVHIESSRALVLASLIMVDAVVLFEEDTPLSVIEQIEPDVLVKGENDSENTIPGAKEVLLRGGRVETLLPSENFSTTLDKV